MTLGTITNVLPGGGRPGEPLFFDQIQMDGDSTYTAGGSLTFSETVAAALKKTGIELVGIMKAGPCGGYELIYDKAADALLMYYGDYDAADGPAIQVPDGDYNAVTLDLVVLYR